MNNEELKELQQLITIYKTDRRGLLLENLIAENKELEEKVKELTLLTKGASKSKSTLYVIALITCLLVAVIAFGSTLIQAGALAAVNLWLIFSLIKGD